MRSFNHLTALLLAPSIAVGQPMARPSVTPSRVAEQTFKGCRWGRVDGRVLSIWSYACDKKAGDVRLVADDAAGGFALASFDNAARGRRTVIRSFVKPASATISAILSVVLRETGPHEASCRLVEHDKYGSWGRVWLLEPTGAEKRSYDAANAVEPQPNPCGNLGIGPAGDRFFRQLPGQPSRIIYADMGSEIQIFDPDTLRMRR